MISPSFRFELTSSSMRPTKHEVLLVALVFVGVLLPMEVIGQLPFTVPPVTDGTCPQNNAILPTAGGSMSGTILSDRDGAAVFLKATLADCQWTIACPANHVVSIRNANVQTDPRTSYVTISNPLTGTTLQQWQGPTLFYRWRYNFNTNLQYVHIRYHTRPGQIIDIWNGTGFTIPWSCVEVVNGSSGLDLSLNSGNSWNHWKCTGKAVPFPNSGVHVASNRSGGLLHADKSDRLSEVAGEAVQVFFCNWTIRCENPSDVVWLADVRVKEDEYDAKHGNLFLDSNICFQESCIHDGTTAGFLTFTNIGNQTVLANIRGDVSSPAAYNTEANTLEVFARFVSEGLSIRYFCV